MQTTRLALVLTFAGGCLSGAMLIGFWSQETERLPSPTKQRVARTSEAVLLPIPTTSPVRERALPEEAPDVQPEPGSSVADVLARLEAEYKKGLPVVAREHVPSNATDTEEAQAAEPVQVHTQAAATAAVFVATTPAAAPAAESEPTAVLASRDDAPPRNVSVHVGDNNETTHVGDVINGDVIQGDVVFVPPPVYGYFPLYATRARERVGTPAYGPAYTPPEVKSHGVTFASSWTVPQARLGYDSGLIPMLVK